MKYNRMMMAAGLLLPLGGGDSAFADDRYATLGGAETAVVNPPYSALANSAAPATTPPPAGAPWSADPWTPPAATSPGVLTDGGVQTVACETPLATPAAPSLVQPVAYESSAAPRRHGVWFAMLELTVLDPSYSDAVLSLDDNATGVGPRLSLGWESAAGLGLRTRFWGIDTESEAVLDGGLRGPIGFNASRFDFDVYHRFRFRYAEVLAGASITAATQEMQVGSRTFAQSSGAGVGFLIEAKHWFYESTDSAWAVFGRGRWAQLAGQWEMAWRDDNDPGDRTQGDVNLNVGELALGIEYRRHLRRSDLVAQCSMESQSWEESFLLKNLGLLGTTVGVGMEW